MDKNDTGTEGISEAELKSLLASLKVEPAPEADFEARFVYDLRERLARESVCCSARSLLWAHVVQFFANFGPRKLAYGASTLGLGALAVGFLVLPGEQETAGGVASVRGSLSRLERSLSALRPNCGHDAACTTIRVGEQKKAPYTDASLASGSFSTSFDSVAASPDTIPANLGLDATWPNSFSSYSSGVRY